MWPVWCPASVSRALPVHHSLILTADIFWKICLPGAENKFLLTFNLRNSKSELGWYLLISRLLEEFRWISRCTNVSSLLSALSAASVSPCQLQLCLGNLGTFPCSCLPPQLLQGITHCYNFIYLLFMQVRDVFCRRVNFSPNFKECLNSTMFRQVSTGRMFPPKKVWEL